VKFKTKSDLKLFLDEQAYRFESPSFFVNDPLGILHLFTKKEDQEIIGFLTATIAWGNRKSIITNATRMCEIMDKSPLDFIINHTPEDYKKLRGFVHRTFNEVDLAFFFSALQRLYKANGGLENALGRSVQADGALKGISDFKRQFFETEHLKRTEKHVSDPLKGSAAKRINMFLRWMVRSSEKGVDLGLWKELSPSKLMIPLDVHTGNVGRKLGLLKRKQNDWKSVEELTNSLIKLDSEDPIKYDFALFGLGVEGEL